ncbi:fumarylacetoacetate hydrolase [Kribbella sp. ALI-6-A]|uniref:fumarylacetoacetate hydrolase family protein n=1 Tax=Kribbella sp. ALI-6-A TaxID=1933817 RepID=UPI00097BFF2C|nr:fumarylacetoacetate hydrolase family protein [Kribbella sp. ALI-6-A]ONI78523.1 fumarylacetoacetate hydrolase [Kribbella sp. ALI-6-A]
MKLANVSGHAVLVTGDRAGINVHQASGGEFGPGPHEVYQRWAEFERWVAAAGDLGGEVAFEPEDLGCPSPSPRQVVAVGLNYSAHAAEAGFAVPERLPPTFTKFPSSLAGPYCEVELPPGGRTDWEVELVVVVGRSASRVGEHEAWDHVAGLSVGQDLSERISQLDGPAPQFSLGKSYPRFGPVGPWLVTPDELGDRDNLELSCAVNGETVQAASTKEMIFPVPALIAQLSDVITLFPGDLIFTGTPAGVGQGRQPQRFLADGDVLVSRIEGIGEIRQTFTAGGR